MIIAELCGNHKGDPRILEEMVDQAAEAGAWGVKIQSFFADDLTDEWRETEARVKQAELSWATHAKFVNWCSARGVVPITSVYTFEHASYLWERGFQWIKIGSAQARDEKLIENYIVAGFKVLLSTGGHDLKHVSKVGPLAGVFHCVSRYPSKPSEANLLRMLEMKKHFPGLAIGLSDHTDPTHFDWDAPTKMALYLGASYIEKHFTILPRSETKDGPVSIDFAQLKELCRWDRLTQEERRAEHPALGLMISPQTLEEKELIHRYKGRWKQ